MNKNFYEVFFNNDEDDVTIVQCEKKLKKGDIVLFNQWNEWYHGTVQKQVDTLLGIVKHSKAPKVLRFVDIEEYNKENEVEIQKAIILNAMNLLEDDIKVKEQRLKLASKDERYRELLNEFDKLEKPIQIPDLKKDDEEEGEESAY